MDGTLKLLDIVRIAGEIKLETGMTIGGIETFGIGGIDKQVVKEPLKEDCPYIPGSTLKGKMRSLVELADGKVKLSDGKPHSCTNPTCGVCAVFGCARAKDNEDAHRGPTRLIVHDAPLDVDAPEAKQFFQSTGRWVDLKTENTINRVTGTAEHPRTFERVPAGMTFKFAMSYRVFEMPDKDGNPDKGAFDLKNLGFIKLGLQLVANDYIGSSGSRGYGRISLHKVTVRATMGMVKLAETSWAFEPVETAPTP